MASVTDSKPKAIKEEYVEIGPLKRYQIRKNILPAYSMNLTQAVYDLKRLDMKTNEKGTIKYWHSKTLKNGEVRKTDYKVLGFKELERINSLPVLPNDGIKFAVVAYVEGSKRFAYQSGQKEAFKGVYDIDGGRVEMVKWGSKEGYLDKKLTEENLTGAVVLLILSKFSEDRPISVDDIVIIEEPLDLKGDTD
jgi:hypothetical protein